MDYINNADNDNLINQLRDDLVELIASHDELLYISCENIRAHYVILFGGKEYRIIKLQMDYKKLKSKIALINEELKESGSIDKEFICQIEANIEEEYEDYKQILDEKSNEINWATKFITSEKLKGEDIREFKRMYKIIVKHLHPDLYPNLSADDKETYAKALEAYQNGWYEFIEVYYRMLADKDISYD